jgi:hypothetical protein
MSDYITANPNEADEVIQERLHELKKRMSVTVAGLIEIAESLE